MFDNIIAYTISYNDYHEKFHEIIYTLEKFYEGGNYEPLKIAISLLRDYGEIPHHYPSKETFSLLTEWRKK